MQGHIRRRTHTTKTGKKTVRWYVVIDIGKTLEGKRRQKWHVGYASRADAEQARAELVSGIYTGTYIEPTRLTLGGWISDHWLASIAARARPTTIASYMANLRHHVLPTIGGLRLHELTGAHLDALYADLLRNGRVKGSGGLHPRTVGNIHLLVHLALADARAAGIVQRNESIDRNVERARDFLLGKTSLRRTRQAVTRTTEPAAVRPNDSPASQSIRPYSRAPQPPTGPHSSARTRAANCSISRAGAPRCHEPAEHGPPVSGFGELATLENRQRTHETETIQNHGSRPGDGARCCRWVQ